MDRDNKLLKCILDAGELILKSGGEINRVEDTMTRMCRAYGFLQIEAFAISSFMFLTVTTRDDRILTQTRRVREYDTNLQRVDRMNQLAREVCADPLEPEALEKKIREIQELKVRSHRSMALLYGGIAAVFSVFYGGGAREAAVAGGVGICLYFLLYFLEHLLENGILRYAFCSGAGSLLLCLLRKSGVYFMADAVIMGNIMLLIPGLVFTNSIRDMLNGDTMTGLLRVCESLLRTVAIAAGFIFVMTLFGFSVETQQARAVWVRMILQILTAGAGAVGFAMMFQLGGKRLLLIGCGGAVSWGIFLFMQSWGHTLSGLFFAVLAAAAVGEIAARRLKTPVLVIEVPLLIPLIPGGDLYRMMVSMMREGIQQSMEEIVWLVQEVFLIGAGVILMSALASIFVKGLRRIRNGIEVWER